jgi:ABC-type methionine transport system permease subunit
MRTSAFWTPVIASLVATPICLLLGIASGGAGHGNYFPAKLLFPFTMLSTILFGSITVPFILLAVAQFPAYGVILGHANEKGGFMRAACAVLTVHALAVVACLTWIGENFS